MAGNKWIQSAIKKKGAFRKWCQQHGFSGATNKCIAYAKQVAKRTGNKTLLRRAVLAMTLKRMRRRQK